MPAKDLVHALCPPALWNLARRLNRRASAGERIRCTGDYPSWEAARRASQGYDAAVILEKTRAALLRVKNGEAAFERDSVAFTEMEHDFPLLACLLRIAAAAGGRLSVLDFGGALGSTYFQCRGFLAGAVRELRWHVVEQSAHVACGRADFAGEELRFHDTIDACLREDRPDVLLLSSVVQYLPAPYAFVADVVARDFPWIIVARTGFMRDGRTRLTVEHVPAWIYPSTYPAWFLDERRFLACFDPRYRCLATLPALDTLHPEGGEADYKGFLFQRESAT